MKFEKKNKKIKIDTYKRKCGKAENDQYAQ